MKLSDSGEFELIEKIKGMFPAPGGGIVKGIGDDCAVVESSGDRVMLFTTDVLIEGVHFTKDLIDPENLGRKALAVNISDIAAMGGKPLYAILTLGSPEYVEVEFIEKILSGINSLAGEFDIEVIGGDTALSPERLMLDIFLVGESGKDEVLYRSGAGAGQVVFVTGKIGSSAAGLDILKKGIKSEKFEPLVRAHIMPRPHQKEGNLIASSGLATSLIDVSDGMVSDLRHICEGSKVGAVIKEDDLPISEECRLYCGSYGIDTLEFALFGGEDYVLMGTVPEHMYYKLRDQMKSGGCAFFPIGRTRKEPGILLQDKSGEIKKVEVRGYDHFRFSEK
jgi:thiamine-monophosphate kinase